MCATISAHGGILLSLEAAGPKALKYGATTDNVLWMQVALTDGHLIEVGSRSIKQNSSYNPLHLFVGSEDTLGVITQATLKLAPLPQHVGAALDVMIGIKRLLDPNGVLNPGKVLPGV